MSISPKAANIILLTTIFVLLTIGCVTVSVGLFTPYFLTWTADKQRRWSNTGDLSTNLGIYSFCIIGKDKGETCISLMNAQHDSLGKPDWMKACQYLGIIASILSFVGWGLLLCWLCQHATAMCFKWCESTKTQYMKYPIILCLLTGWICYILLLVVYISMSNKLTWNNYKFDWGYLTAWIGIIPMAVADAMLFIYPIGFQPHGQIRNIKSFIHLKPFNHLARIIDKRISREGVNTVLLTITIVILITGGLVVSVSIFTPYFLTQTWRKYREQTTVNIGLYTHCNFERNKNVDCKSLINTDSEIELDDADWLKGSQALGIIASILTFIGWIMLSIWACKGPKALSIKYIIMLVILISWICYVIMLALYVVKFTSTWEEYTLNWGYLTAWIGVCLVAIGDMLLFLQPGGSQPQPAVQSEQYTEFTSQV